MACGWWKRRDIDSGEKFTWKARGLVNATGPWVKQFFDEGMHLRSPYGIRLIKGSHIVVPRFAYPETRLIFCRTKINA